MTKNNLDIMNRRDAIKRTSLILGYAVSASSAAIVLNGCKADSEVVAGGLDNWSPTTMSKEEGRTIAELAETILPKTDTPGAIEAGVHSYLDNALRDLSTEVEREGFKSWLRDFQERAQQAIGKSFVEANAEERSQFLTAYEKEAKLAAAEDKMPQSIWWQVKEQILLGYFTSEVGQTQALIHVPVPGAYIGCVPYDEVGGMWAI